MRARNDKNLLQAYARAFREAVPTLPGDFFIRACFLNPLQFLDMKRIRTLGGRGWDWIQGMDDRLFDATFSGDKADVFFQTKTRSKVAAS